MIPSWGVGTATFASRAGPNGWCRGNRGFTNNSSYTPVLYLIANFTGYTGSSFLDFRVPVAISTT